MSCVHVQNYLNAEDIFHSDVRQIRVMQFTSLTHLLFSLHLGSMRTREGLPWRQWGK